jgi:hypothetical protein
MTVGISESEALLQIFEVELLVGTFEVVELAVGTFEQAGIVETELMTVLFARTSKVVEQAGTPEVVLDVEIFEVELRMFEVEV